MRVKIKFFSAHRDAVGNTGMEIELGENTDISGMLDVLMGRYPELKKLADYTVLSLNHKYANGTEVLNDGDEVAVFPPVEGG